MCNKEKPENRKECKIGNNAKIGKKTIQKMKKKTEF